VYHRKENIEKRKKMKEKENMKHVLSKEKEHESVAEKKKINNR
jgi:hypothetical protein